MPRITPLPPEVVARIAAGEVIERPASVFKELVENSIDAGCKRVEVEVGQGGLEYLRVCDDGCGIHADDLPLAFRPHATSKLKTSDDLFRIGTLGFRGEGLASIAGVAQVLLQSRPAGDECGAEIRCHGGEVQPARPWNGSPGTRIEVRHLFYNVPVRRKFLRGPATEMGHVAEAFTRLALSQLHLHLKLSHNGKVVHDVPASLGLLDRVGLFHGDELRDRLLMVEAERHGMTLGGYVADPSRDCGEGRLQYVFVNGRWVRDRLVAQALQEAYRGLLMVTRCPAAFLFLELPPELVDVNVHPTKAEVRFRRPGQVTQFIQEAIRSRLEGADLVKRGRRVESAATLPFEAESGEKNEASRGREPPEESAPRIVYAPAPVPTLFASGASTPPPRAHAPGSPGPAQLPSLSPAPGGEGARGGEIRAIQLHNLYLVVEVPDGMLVIDQHALHERVLFERLRARLAGGKLEVQRLLVPETISLPPAQAALLLEHTAALAELGLDVSDFGGGTVLLGGYPAVLGKRPPRDILRAVVDHLQAQERPPSREALLEGVMALMACHAAVRAGDRLSPELIAELVAQRDLARDSHHCPHGRPTSLLFTTRDLERQFGRT